MSFAKDEGPPEFQITADWRKAHDMNLNCKNYFTIEAIRVLGRQVKNASHVKVLVEIQGDWVEWKGARSPRGPCAGVKRSEGIGQKIRKELTYMKYGDKWNLDNYRAAERN
jgi:hypothetical protein